MLRLDSLSPEKKRQNFSDAEVKNEGKVTEIELSLAAFICFPKITSELARG